MKITKLIKIAEAYASLSKDQSTQVGCVVVGPEGEVRSSGFNGMPRGVNDSVPERHIRPEKYSWMAHAEQNAVAQAAKVGTSLDGCSLIVTALLPCTTCAQSIIQSGIKEVLAPHNLENARWDEQAKVALTMFAEAGVQVHRYDSEHNLVTDKHI
jgi:dCMP deaminase